MQHLCVRASLALSLLCLAGSPLAAQQGYHLDSKVGFKLRLPHKWKRWPVEKDRRFVTGHYVQIADWPVKGLRNGHRPTLRVIVLPKRPEPPQAAAGTKAEPQPVVEFYSDYKDYLVRNLSGTLAFRRADSGTIDGVPYQQWTISRRVDERSYTLTTWLMQFEAHTVALEYLIHKDYVVRLRDRVKQSFRSFRRAPIDPELAARDPWAPPVWLAEPERWRKMDARERQSRRARFGTELAARVKKELAPGFRMKESQRFLLVTDGDASYATAVGKAADSWLVWAEEQFDDIGEDPVAKAVIRIFDKRADYDQYRVRSRRSSHYVPRVREIVIPPNNDRPKDLTGLEDLVQGLFHFYVYDKNPKLYDNLPEWIRRGLYGYMRQSKLARGRLVFEMGDSEQATVREATRRKRLETPKRIISEQAIAFGRGRRGGRDLRNQRARLLRFLLEPGKRRQKVRFPDEFLTDYMVAVGAAIEKYGMPAVRPGAGRTPGLTEAIRKKRGEDFVKRRRALLDAVNKVACPWDDARWKALHKAYLAYNKKL